MPRISKRDKIQNSFLIKQENQVNISLERKVDKVYITAGYSRLSRLNSGNDSEDTIENQWKSIEEYIKSQSDMKFAGNYSDNGFTGSDFQRPQWKELMEAVGAKKIDCIVFKDFSRLGRNFLETSEYLEQIFPEMGVRVISILDNYDSNSPVRDENGILIPLKNLMNDMYIKDLRAKGRAVRERKMKDGEYTRAVAPYGYLKAKDKSNTLLIDNEVAWIIKLIFQWRKEEQLSTLAIATRLNQMEIMPPKQYQHIKGLKKTKDAASDMKWSAVTIRRILSNKVYCGFLIQGKIKGRGKNIKRVDEAQWYVKENTHAAIISLSDYEMVQKTFPDEPKKRRSDRIQVEDVFTGLLYCHNCKQRMISKYNGSGIHYVCKRRELESKDYCRDITFGMKTLSEAVLKILVKQISCILTDKELFINLANNLEYNRAISEFQRDIRNLDLDRTRNIQKQDNLYEDYASGILEKEEYLYIKDQYIKKEQSIDFKLQYKKEELETYKNIEKRARNLIQDMEKFSLNPHLTRDILQLFIGKIEIGEKNTVYITLSFTNILDEVYEIAGQERGENVC